MSKVTSSICAAALLASLVFGSATRGYAADAASQDDAVYNLGSILLSVFYFPVKLVTCVGTQVGAGTAYVLTYGVAGNFDGGTNGKQIGEVANRACTGPWVIRQDDVKKDYE